MKEIFSQRIVPVAVLDRVEDAAPVARALLAGGLSTLELTLRTPHALECVCAIRNEVPEMKVGVGTVLTPGQADAARDAGAYFAVSPGFNRNVVLHAQMIGLPFYPGVMTPSDVERALEVGCRLQKLFPAAVAGGIEMIKALAGPYAHTGVKFIPLGGIHVNNMRAYLDHPMVAAVGGSWLVDKAMVAAGDWSGITRLVEEAVSAAKA